MRQCCDAWAHFVICPSYGWDDYNGQLERCRIAHFARCCEISISPSLYLVACGELIGEWIFDMSKNMKLNAGQQVVKDEISKIRLYPGRKLYYDVIQSSI